MAVATKTTRTQAETDIQGVGVGSIPDGVTIGPYQVVRFLGRGGMGEVYEVFHTLLGKRFALKLISKELSQDEKARNLFRREGREAGNLDHPNIVRVDDCGEVDGRMYLRMELIEGRPCHGDTCVTLTDYIIACSLRVPPKEAIPILHDILRGLNYAHSRRRVHRDIKPSNILMTPEAAKIGDFGLVMSGARPGGDMSQMSEVVVMGLGAQSMMNATQTSGASAAAGTPDYMAPELLSGSVEANYSTDVYSVGILLLEMLTGSRRVGAAKPSQLLRSHYKLDPWWDQLYERSTAYHEDRFANAGDMLRFFTEVAGLAEIKPSREEGVQKTASGPATTRVLANWGNAPAAEPSAPQVPESAPPAKPALEPPRVATKPATPPAPTPDRAPSPALSGEAKRSPTSPQPTKVDRSTPWMHIGVGGVLAVLGASLYLATRTSENPEKKLKGPDLEPLIPSRPRSGDATVSPSKPASPAEPPASKLRPAPLAVGSGAVPGAPGVKAPTNAQTPRLIQTDQQDEVRRKQEESMVSEALKSGALGEAWKVVSKTDSLVNRDLRDSVLGAYQALKKVEEAFVSQNVERLRESLVAWQRAKPVQLADPEVIIKARDLVERSTSEGKQQLLWRDQLKTAIANEDVPSIRNLLAEKRYETDESRVLGERTIKRLEDISERFRVQAREGIKKEDLAGARLAVDSLNQHLKRTRQQPDSQIDGEIRVAQRAILERKVEKAVAELNRYTPTENPPPISSDPDLIGNQRYQEALKLALKRQEDWKIANAPKPIQELPVAPPPNLEPPPSSPPPPVPANPRPEVGGSVEKKSFEALKTRISGLGNRGITQQAKQDMINFLQSYQKNHPEDAREASRLIENLRNR